jgi:hypothetical protein
MDNGSLSSLLLRGISSSSSGLEAATDDVKRAGARMSLGVFCSTLDTSIEPIPLLMLLAKPEEEAKDRTAKGDLEERATKWRSREERQLMACNAVVNN